ncbi:hypothetical protein RvY_00940 [Ramazzottius varieornatus]|uniref:Uncharacterized protein n=1 Tax=Ramazzottius varieornatus TaxID=947166 RepID=A0A1D1ULR4_RAMVA|nr:hypothetical protein RvY_00940 [Ramazzottius varieornatus]
MDYRLHTRSIDNLGPSIRLDLQGSILLQTDNFPYCDSKDNKRDQVDAEREPRHVQFRSPWLDERCPAVFDAGQDFSLGKHKDLRK